MKLKLPKLLLVFLLLSYSHVTSIAFAGEVSITDPTIRQEYTEDTTVVTTLPSLLYEGWVNSDPQINSNYKGAILNCTGNLIFKGSYEITISDGTTKSLGGFIASSKTITFDGISKLSLLRNKVEIEQDSFNYSGILYANNTIAFKNMDTI